MFYDAGFKNGNGSNPQNWRYCSGGSAIFFVGLCTVLYTILNSYSRIGYCNFRYACGCVCIGLGLGHIIVALIANMGVVYNYNKTTYF